MTRPIIRLAILTLAAAPLPAAAQSVFVSAPPASISQDRGALTGLRASVARDLQHYGYGDTDVRRLNASQLAAIHHLAHSGRSEGDIRGHIGATLRRGLLQRGIDRILR
ncbi:hypothetical protein [Jannaschia formosa]|uniref:hypothetical protein n=1 Tax=Jannaschia formosa TaxID=2259592 RepID=UPI000E1B9FBA|nr:hypothetical protein [Jannaschia formosa]TFL20090.1 hypothetical protein DR046_01725 [Jannaschia formosa]